MRKNIALIITLLFIVVSSFGQTTLSTSSCKYIPTFDDRQKIKIGDYEFGRLFVATDYVEKRCYGKISYIYDYNEREYGASEEINALISHIERNKEYYEEKYKCKIENVSIWRNFGNACLLLVVTYPDWDEEHNRQYGWDEKDAEDPPCKAHIPYIPVEQGSFNRSVFQSRWPQQHQSDTAVLRSSTQRHSDK